MKNNKGFTLIELLAVIAILAIILLIVVPKVFKSVSESKVRACEIQMDYIRDAAATYFVDNKYKEYKDGITYDEAAKTTDGVDVSLVSLISLSLLKGTITNPVTGDELVPENTKINIKNDDETYSYDIYVSDEKVICK